MKRTALMRKTPLARSGFKPRSLVKPSARGDGTVKTLKVWKSGKVKPNTEESEWMAKVAEFGCIVCHLFHRAKTPCAVHHIVEGGRRVGHLWTFGLCDPGHHQNAPVDSGKISRHPDKARFEAAYGTEYELLEKTKELLEEAE